MGKKYFDKVPLRRILSLTRKKLDDAYTATKDDWETHLKNGGVRLPAVGTNAWHQLMILKCFQGKAVEKQDIGEYVRKAKGLGRASDMQIRHLSRQHGWYVLNRGEFYKNMTVPEGCHLLITTKEKKPGYVAGNRARVLATDWREKLEQYDHACATCGAKIGEYHRYDKSYFVKTLQKGHMNPHKPGTMDNIIPQCRICNQSSLNNFEWDEQGKPRAIAAIRPVELAHDSVKDLVVDWAKRRDSDKKVR